ncbi:uncharacterized protein LOC114574945 [Exaiptasia diaphana]|uniref:Uncharacterized protein n=1 Tax=Exaiptasia diaphana TaxID=2652724 RepID=A0A913YHI4_EXADI|nr:uncharacterized protein LOC114574945 [Exaiptasia diaphana]
MKVTGVYGNDAMMRQIEESRYIELYGDNTQEGDMPRKVYLDVTRESASYFRDGQKNVKKFRQSRLSKAFSFYRIATTDEEKCDQASKEGNTDSAFCITKDDTRFFEMCTRLTGMPQNEELLGSLECASPFGTYRIEMPIDENLPCQDSDVITNKNCKNLDGSESE